MISAVSCSPIRRPQGHMLAACLLVVLEISLYLRGEVVVGQNIPAHDGHAFRSGKKEFVGLLCASRGGKTRSMVFAPYPCGYANIRMDRRAFVRYVAWPWR